MNSKHYLVLSGIVGGVVGSLLTALLVSPVTAQRDKLGEIECTKLTVVSKDGSERPLVVLMTEEDGGYIAVCGNDGKPVVGLFTKEEYGGIITVKGKDGKPGAGLGTNEYGGRIDVMGKDGKSLVGLRSAENGGHIGVWGKDGKSLVGLGIDEDGGRIDVTGKSEGGASMGINEYGNGTVYTWDKNGYRR